MRVLVTGGFGFLGRAVVKVLSQKGHEVIVLSRSGTQPGADGSLVVKADLRDRAAVATAISQARPDGVCHLAGLTSARDSFADPLSYFETNVGGTVNLLRALSPGTQVVFTSTSTVYGSSRPGKLSEALTPQAENPYAASKLAAECAVASTSALGDIGAITLRCFNIAGAVDGYTDPDPTRIINNVLRAAAGEIPHVSVNGDGSAVREFTHVLDVADAVSLALNSAELGKPRTFNVGTGEGIAMLDLVRAAEVVTATQIPVVHRPAANEAHTLISDPSLIGDQLGWRPRRSGLEMILSEAWACKRRG